MKKKLREIIESKIEILSEQKTKDGSLTILAPWIQADRKNKNGRLYPFSLLQREVAQTQKRIESGAAIGSADHPLGASSTLSDVSHIITKLEIDKSGKGWMTAKILPTSKGKNVIEIIKAGGQLGISARGAGTVSQSGRVENDYRLLGIDIVTNPSEPTAVFNKYNVFESQNFDGEENLDDEHTEDREQVMYELLQASYGMALTQGFNGDFDLYCQLHESGLRKVMALPENEKVPTQIIAEAEQQIKDRIYGYFLESQKGGFLGDFNAWKKEYPRLVEMASEEVELSKKKTPEPKQPFKSQATWEEIQLSGFRGTIKEYEEKYPNITIIKPAPPQKLIAENETLEEQTKRVFETLKADNPDSSTTLEDVRRVLKDEYESKREKKIHELAIYRVNKSMAGSGSASSQQMLEKMVAEEVEFIKEKRAEKKRKNWEAYKKLLS